MLIIVTNVFRDSYTLLKRKQLFDNLFVTLLIVIEQQEYGTVILIY